MKAMLRAMARRLLGEYSIYRVLERTRDEPWQPAAGSATPSMRRLHDAAELSKSADPEIRALSSYAANEAACFVMEDVDGIVAACWFWYGETYLRRNFWPLRDGEAKLVQINTSMRQRNRGIAQTLIRYASDQMFQAGFVRLYARVWHSHKASLRAFEGAGWREAALLITVERFGKTLRILKSYQLPPTVAWKAVVRRKAQVP